LCDDRKQERVELAIMRYEAFIAYLKIKYLLFPGETAGILSYYYIIVQTCANPGRLVSTATEFCTLAPSTADPQHVTCARILSFRIGFWKISTLPYWNPSR